MKNSFLIFLSTFLTSICVAQEEVVIKKEKFKPSKAQTITAIDVETFESVECSEDFEFFFEKGIKPQVKIETHENMHQMVQAKVEQGKLKFSFLEKPSLFKKLKFTIFYTEDLKVIDARGESQLYALERMKLPNLSINTFDKSRLFINGDFEIFNLTMDQKSKGELNIKAQSIKVNAMQSSSLIAMFSGATTQFDLYQNATLTIEGDSENSKIRTTNGSTFTGKKFQVNNGEIITELNSEIGIFSLNTLKISASGDSKLYIYGPPKIDILKFDDSASIYKKSRL
jgi:hypothetical protein